MGARYEATAFEERNGWMIYAVDIGRQVWVQQLRDAELAVRVLYAEQLQRPLQDIDVVVRRHRRKLDAMIRSRWLRRLSR